MAAQPNQLHQRRFTQQIDRGLEGGIINVDGMKQIENKQDKVVDILPKVAE